MHNDQHENQWKANEQLRNKMLSNGSKFYDWIITITFYTALHKMHCELHNKGVRSRDIKSHSKLISKISNLLPSIASDYLLLHSECNRVRYKQFTLGVITNSELKLYCDIWDNVIKTFTA
jgi:hypothetical protein